MAKTGLRARSMFHHERDSITAHLKIARHLQDRTGFSIKRIVRALPMSSGAPRATPQVYLRS